MARDDDMQKMDPQMDQQEAGKKGGETAAKEQGKGKYSEETTDEVS